MSIPEKTIETNEERMVEDLLPYSNYFNGHLVLYPTCMVAHANIGDTAHIMEKYRAGIARLEIDPAERIIVVLVNQSANDAVDQAIIMGKEIEFIPCIIVVKNRNVASIELF